MWEVVLIKRGMVFPWKDDYFPRTFRYKAHAMFTKAQVEKNGGKAEVRKVVKT